MQFSLRSLILAVSAIGLCLFVVGRTTKSGSIVVSQKNQPYVEAVLAKHNLRSWTAYSSLGGTLVRFPNPVALTSVDDAIIEDALEKGYCVEIHYNAIIPQFDSKRTVNAGVGLFGRR